MKLTGNLKKQVESAPTKEEKREAVKQAGMLCSDDELDKVAGGFTLDPGSDSINDACPYDPSCHVGKFMSLFCSSCPKKQGEGE